MNIKIKSLTLTNFKCFRSKEISFDSDVTTIKGRNGVGKTTIADAILWCLFGKNSENQSDFDLKTHDVNGKAIPCLDHSVEMVLHIKAIEEPHTIVEANIVNEITLKRTLKETWVKKRGSEEQVFKNNTTEYMVNGEVKTAADYKKYISELVSEDIFRTITNPTYFPSLKWQVQREFLSKMAGEIKPEDIASADNEIKELLGSIGNEDIISYRKHLSYQIKKIKESLDKIPVRLEEQNKALPEKLDWEAISSELSKTVEEYDAIEQKILAIKSGSGDDVRKEELRKQLDDLYTIKRKLEDAARLRELDASQKLNNQIVELSTKFSSLLNTQRDLETKLGSFDTLKERCQSTLKQCELDAQEIRKQWADNLARTISFGESDEFCPTCGQYLPSHHIKEKKDKAIQQLNESKANIKIKLTEQAEKVKQIRAQAENEIKGFENTKSETEKLIENTKEQINTTFAAKQKLEKEKASLPSLEEILSKDSDYQDILKKIETAENEVKSASVPSDDTKALDDLNATKCSLSERITSFNGQLTSKYQYDKVISLIDGIHKEEKDLIKQLSELERKEDIARRYQDRENTILESRINEHFSIVKWKMFRTVNNGGDPFDEPFCECYVDGVAYHDGLNQAARLNGGLDIIKTLCKHYNVYAPIVIDNSESNLNILSTDSQQIRLEVADTDLSIL